MTYPNLKDLESLISQGLVSKRKHPEHLLWVYNYTPKAVTVPITEWTGALEDARGLILNENGEIVGRGFRKFWNYEQVKDFIPWHEECTWDKKEDGSLIIAFLYKGEVIIATRGSFESEQALWAAEWLKTHKDLFIPGVSNLYEAVYPENKIVVDYKGLEYLFFLAHISNDTGLDYIETRPALLKKRTPEYIEGLKKDNTPNEEGYVITFYPSCFRVKIKFDDYVKLHRIRFQTTTHSIWDILRTSPTFEPINQLCEGLPKDIEKKIKDYAFELSAKYIDLKLTCRKKWLGKILTLQTSGASEKTIAQWIKEQKESQQPVLFALWRGKTGTAETALWKALEPIKEPLI